VAEPDLIAFDVFFDYTCPFVYRIARLLDGVRRTGKPDIRVGWRYFSLTQVNSKVEGWTVWDAPTSEKVRGRLAFQAAEAARRQGRFEELHMPLLDARHRDHLDLDEIQVVERVAADAGLEMDRFRRDVNDPTTIEALALDHQHAVRDLGVFGTPTLVFEDGTSAYVRLSDAVNGVPAPDLFERLVSVAGAEPRILEIKRPRRPLPA
jgi:predicted DsbA family dithiol-disulfide isomerase